MIYGYKNCKLFFKLKLFILIRTFVRICNYRALKFFDSLNLQQKVLKFWDSIAGIQRHWLDSSHSRWNLAIATRLLRNWLVLESGHLHRIPATVTEIWQLCQTPMKLVGIWTMLSDSDHHRRNLVISTFMPLVFFCTNQTLKNI